MNYIEIVKKYRTKYDFMPEGFERAWTITNAVANELKMGWGLLGGKKPGQTQWNGCAIDILINMYSNVFVDCLGSSEAEATPVWQERAATPEDIRNWVAPVAEGTTPTPPIPVPPTPVPVIITATDKIKSSNGRFLLTMQDDGNLVIYDKNVPIWASNTSRQ